MELKEFQLNAVKSLFEAMDKPVRDIILKSPTGSGKTIILTYFMHQYIQSYPKTVFVWLTPGKGNLEEQSKAKMDKYIHASQTKLLSDVMTAGFEENDSCFINWEKLTKKGNNALKDSERTNFLEHIEHALNDGLRFIIIVDLDRFEESKTLSVKNLIGRAGRSTAKPIFDFGSVILRPNAMSRFRKVYQKKNILSSKSRLDITDDKMDEKYEEYKEAIKTGEFSDEYNLTNKDLEKLKSDSVTTVVPTLLDMMFTGADFVLPNAVAKEVYEDFQCLYKQYLGRELTAAEKYVFDSAIKIMIWKVHGKTFSKICQERYAYVSNVAQRRFLAKAGQQNRADNLPVRYIAGYSDIPDKELRAYPLFPVGTKGKDVDYDRIVYDTYDFLDKLIGFKLSDLFYAIFHQYYLAYQDNRAERLAKYIKYGTEDSTEIWMLRYGFSFEEIEWLKPCVESIDQTEIRFNGEIESLDDFQRSSIAQYLF